MKRQPRQLYRAAFAAIETLEQRRMLSVTSVNTVDNGDGTRTLNVIGSKNKDTIHVYDDPANETIIVKDPSTNNTYTWTYDDTDYINVVHIDAKQGDDTVVYELVSTYDGDQRSIEVDLSDGNDKFTFDSPTSISGSAGDDNIDPFGGDISDHSSINLEVDGQEKNDTIDIDLSNTSVRSSELLVNVDAGSGNDKVSFESPITTEEEGIDGSATRDALPTLGGGSASDYAHVQINVDLGTGNNLYTQQLATLIQGAQLTVDVDGNSGKDTVQADDNYGLDADAAYFFTANLQGGNDYYNGELSNNYVQEGSEASYNLQGGDGNDRMTLEGVTNENIDTQAPEIRPAAQVDGPTSFNDFGIFQVNMYGGTGNDTLDMWADENNDIIVVNPTVKVRPAGAVSGTPGGDTFPMFINTGEDGSVRVVLSGDAGNDKVGLFLGAARGSGGDYDLSVLGAAGKDSVAAGFADDTLDPDSTVTFGPSGAILLDGGRDADKYQVVSYGDSSTDPVTLFTPFDIRAVESAVTNLLPPLVI